MKKLLVSLILLGCSELDQSCPEEIEEAEAELVTVRASRTYLPGDVGLTIAECPADHHVVRGWCSLYAVDQKVGVDPMNAYGTDPIQVRGRWSIHHPQRDAWECNGLADELVRMTAHVECRSGGGMTSE